MRVRIISMRRALHTRLAGHLSPELHDCYTRQRGMFTYTGLSPEQVDRLRIEHGIYLIRSGRMCVAGVNAANVDAVCQAISAVVNSNTAQ